MSSAGCSSATDVPSQAVASTTAVASADTVIPDGWVLRQGPGFRVALPPTWADRPDNMRGNPQAALEVGVPFTGQPKLPPLLTGFVEYEEVGTLSWRVPILQAQLQLQLPQATMGEIQQVEVAGATDAVFFDMLYDIPARTSVLDTPVEAATLRQRELVIETVGLPKFGFRFAAPVDDFDPEIWDGLLNSLVVVPTEAAVEPTP